MDMASSAPPPPYPYDPAQHSFEELLQHFIPPVAHQAHSDSQSHPTRSQRNSQPFTPYHSVAASSQGHFLGGPGPTADAAYAITAENARFHSQYGQYTGQEGGTGGLAQSLQDGGGAAGAYSPSSSSSYGNYPALSTASSYPAYPSTPYDSNAYLHQPSAYNNGSGYSNGFDYVAPSPNNAQYTYDASPQSSADGSNGYHYAASVSPPASGSFSPHSIASPSTSNPHDGGSFIHNEALARILADAQAQGQLQAQAQAAFQSSYLATLSLLPKPQSLLPIHGSGQPQPPPSSSSPSMLIPPPPHTASMVEHHAPISRSAHDVESKKRRILEPSPSDSTSTPASRSTRASLSGPSTSSHSRPPRSSNAVTSGRKLAMAPIASSSSKPPTLQDFDLSAEASNADLARPIRQSVSSSSVELIANAGISTSAEQRKFYREDNAKIPIARRPIAPHPPGASGPHSGAALKGKAIEKKSEKATPTITGGVVKKVDKRKKGEKGHNAVERRYRNNINSNLAALRDIVPALRHLKPLPSMPTSRRRASQFTLSSTTASQAPPGLIDGIPAAKTLSKGTILTKAIEYITFLQSAREDGKEDIELFKAVVSEMVAGGATLIETFEKRRAVREIEREKMRATLRKEQEAIDDEDGSDDDEEEEEKPDRSEAQPKHDDHKMDHEDQPVSGPSPPHPFPPSPNSSDGQSNPISPFDVQHSAHPSRPGQAPPRVMLGAFMGLSFAGGLGYDVMATTTAEEAAELVGARAWATHLVRRSTAPPAGPSLSTSSMISSHVVHPALLTGLVFLGVASVVAALLYILYPIFAPSVKYNPVTTRPDPVIEDEQISQELPRCFYRQQRRAEALASLAELNEQGSKVSTYVDECKVALKARRELLRLVGAPTYGLLPALAKEALATALRNVTTLRVGSFSTWSESDRLEAAVAWVRIAEIEGALGGAQIHFLARAYTFLRLFNLSRSKHWPQTTSSTSRPHVNAVLALHLDSLGQPLSANALWSQAVKADRKKSDTVLDPWTEIALSTSHEQVRSILSATKKSDDYSSPSDTVPLLRVSEAKCEAALRETWATIFVGVVQTQANLSPSARFSTIVNQPKLESTIRHVLAATSEGSPIHSMAKVTRALCAFYTGRPDALVLARELVMEARADGPVSRLGCASAFFSLLLGEDFSLDQEHPPSMEVDILASATVGWLIVRQQSETLLSAASVFDGENDFLRGGYLDGNTESVDSPKSTTSALPLLTSPRTDPALIAFCASPVADALSFLRAAGLDGRAKLA